MKETEDNILQHAFKLFLQNNFEKVSMSRIENATGNSRTAIYYYAKSKEDLFIKVIDRFVLQPLDVKNKVPNTDSTLYDFIARQIDGVKRTMRNLMKMSENNSNSYMNLIFQAAKYYPGFGEKYMALSEEELDIWKKVIRNAIIKEEVRGDIDIEMEAMNFRYAQLGMACDMSFANGLDPDRLLRVWMYNYNRIRQ